MVSVVAAQQTGPRTPDGHPDFQGAYEFATLTPLQRPTEFEGKPFLSDREAAEYVSRLKQARNADLRSSDPLTDLLGSYNEFWFERPTALLNVRGRHLTSRIVDPPDGRVPALTPSAQQRRAASARSRQGRGSADGPEDLDLPTRCMSPSPVISPGGNAGVNLLQIVQTADHLVIHTELMSVLRIVSLKRAMHPPPSARSRSGDSIGRWEGDTLIVDTTNYGGAFGFDFADVDENLHVTERFSRTDDDGVLYEATIDDPTAFVRPWTMTLLLRRTNARMFEFACHEGNYSLTNILRGARAEEQRAKNAPAQVGVRPPEIDPAAARIASPILERLDRAWTDGDGGRFAAEFTDDADVINVSGDHLRTRSGITTQLQAMFGGVFKGSTHRSRTLEMTRSLAPGVIIVVSSSVIDVPAGPLAPVATSRQTFILLEREGVWQIRHWHNTSIRAR
jgi:uncharacterized protein (TIGR02246 family)